MNSVAVIPGVSIGPLCLGASLHDVLTIIKEDPQLYPKIDVHHSQTEPVTTPIVVTLPKNGLRLRFDGRSDLIKTREDTPTPSGPIFKRIYELFGPSYPGEYFPPRDRSQTGTYVSSWPGVAFNFPLQHSAWSKDKDHVALLGSHAASPATSMALFEGKSWSDARRDLFVRQPTGPRLSQAGIRPRDNLPVDLEHAVVFGDGRIELQRHCLDGSFVVVLNETTVQDLTTELGTPDATHRPEGERAVPEETAHRRTGSTSRPRSNGRSHAISQPSSYSSTGTDTFETEFEPTDVEEDAFDRASRQKFWCYFNHGLDILVGTPTESSTLASGDPSTRTPLSTSPHLVVLKVVIHGNVPGSYAFNRHRRLRWTIVLPTNNSNGDLNTEAHFENEMKPILLAHYTSHFDSTHPSNTINSELGRGKVVNRTWGGGGAASSESSFFLPDADEDVEDAGADGLGGRDDDDSGSSEQWLGNTKLYAFPGLAFEVLENGAVCGLTVG
ncbi:hypothetical protein LTR78_004735 [Recurvomyces mirabilis]|uniref:Uncharacterized protein n=1 Tax=Recurvomyces mirabilis TaxID=574656 RepID=A0AAE0WP56_9PEZI|nr:hypothetical protein LTR78_004735 [Recurvomyces mirabilis]KAK5157907.1 hypothetical protein LTS14_003829 [Recurvomyces mirabilis]